MILKSLTAGVILSCLAGGAVYFGMGEELSKNSMTSTAAAAEVTDESIVTSPSADVVDEAKAKTSSSKKTLEKMMGGRDATPEQTTEAREEDTPEAPKKRWLDEYMKSDAPEQSQEAEQAVEDSENIVIAPDPELEDPEVKGPELEDEGKRLEETVTITVEEKELDDGSLRTTTTKLVTVNDPDGGDDIVISKEVETIVTSPEAPMPEVVDPDPIVIEPSAPDTPRRVVMTPMTPKATGSFKVKADPALMAILLEETAKLDIPDMRDQAYLNIVDFALSKSDRDTAEVALVMLSREELRDTARGRVAVSLAKAGRSEAAFDVLDELEIEELKGPIRLQIIEAITSAQSATE